MQLIPDRENHRRFGEAAVELTPEERSRVRDEVVEACKPIAQSWPMKTFAYRNPLRGCEYVPFDDAIREAKHLLGGSGYAEQRRTAFSPSHGGIKLSHFSEACAKERLCSSNATES